MTPLQADTFRQYGQLGSGLILKGVLTNRTFRPVVTMRWCQALHQKRGAARLLLPFCKLLHRVALQLGGFDIEWQTRVGPGLSLTHGWAMVISPSATIGANVTLFHGVTLGRRDRIARDGTRQMGFPVIEDEVWIGPHATIVGGVTVGRGSRIGPGAVVTEDVPPYSIVSGNPSQIVKSQCTPDVSNRAPIETSAS
jgi:serine O-acetyltransferase